MKELRNKLNNELERLVRKTINFKIYLKVLSIFIIKNYSEKKDEKKKDNKGIREIKKFVENYILN